MRGKKVNSKTIFIGPTGGGKMPSNGASIKNSFILDSLYRHNIPIYHIDTERWKTNPRILLKLFFVILFHRKSRYILSLNSISAARVIRFLHAIGIEDIVYWVIGGCLPQMIEERILPLSIYKNLRKIFVEGISMKTRMENMGIPNVEVVPNFKHIPTFPTNDILTKKDDIIRYVFLSRITKEKGCSLIFQAIQLLKSKKTKPFSVSFYGPIEKEYKKEFLELLQDESLASYEGFLDLRKSENYKTLLGFDAFLFPTFWQGEGFPGVFIDAFSVGLPVLASDWSMNSEVVQSGMTGILYPSHNAKALADAMLQIQGSERNTMRVLCREKARQYDVENVLNETFLKELIQPSPNN